MSEKNECGINGKSSAIKTCFFQKHLKPDREGLGVFKLTHKVKNCVFFCQEKNAYFVRSRPLPCASALLFSQEFYDKSLFETILIEFLKFAQYMQKHFFPFDVLSQHFFPEFLHVL